MRRLVSYINTTKILGLVLKQKFDIDLIWRMKFYVDADWDGDKDTRRSFSGCIIEINNCVIEWGSRGKTVYVCSCTAEYVYIFDIVKEIMYIRNMDVFMGLDIELPITIHCDNVGALYLAKNSERK